MRICIAGAGTRFLSGLSTYTHRLAHELAVSNDVSVILMRQLTPAALYPGRARVGKALSRIEYDDDIAVYDGIDWYWGRTMSRAAAFLRSERPDVLILEWWTGAVFHSYLALARIARSMDVPVIVEFHELLDPGEARLPLVQGYARLMGGRLLRHAQGLAFHSEADRDLFAERYGVGERETVVFPHGPYDQFVRDASGVEPRRDAPRGVCNVLFFGLIRPYKGLDDLVRAFDLLDDDEVCGYWLTVVGETWEGWHEPARLMSASRHSDRITFINRYVADSEVGPLFAGADAVALPYHRSCASGVLHLAMASGVPVIVTPVGGLVEAVADYAGAVMVPPQNPRELVRAMHQVAELGRRGKKFDDPGSWATTRARIEDLCGRVLGMTRESNRASASAGDEEHRDGVRSLARR